MKVKIKKLSENSILPSYSKSGDAGMDLTAVSRIFDKDGAIYVDNEEGPDEEGESFDFVSLPNDGYAQDRFYKIGERVGQLIILPYPQIEFEEVDKLTDTERGEGGFGHTGK